MNRTVSIVLASLVCLLGSWSVAVTQAPDWIVVDYTDLLDGRRLSHSGESVETLLTRLQGRALPVGNGRPGDALTHVLLDPLLEPYAFVLSDALDALEPARSKAIAWIELGSLWLPGERQPAWVELLRSRQFLVESDGAGQLRLVLPADNGTGYTAGRGAPRATSVKEAEAAYRLAWPVLRHVFAAERARLAKGAEAPHLEVTSFVYRHAPEWTQFTLGREPFVTRVDSTAPDGMRPPLDLEALGRFLEGGLQLEGARLEADGTLRLFGSQPASPPTMLGHEISLADVAVAHRAIFHGGLAEPYMSLDRGFSPQAAIVNYGGRLRDTRLGLVSLLCDIRFKTFSLGLGILEGTDLRESLRKVIDRFRTHIERFSANEDSAQVGAQQTRLWFYPDTVDLTVSVEGDVLAMRRPRLAAASERVEQDGGTARTVPPWTQATVSGINADYDRLAGFFPELADLDQVVRLLSLFTWLQQARLEGLPVPDLDVLLTTELPALATPRTYPQLLAFTALPRAGAETAVDVFDRVPFGEALERLNPTAAPGPAHERLERAIAVLDPAHPQSGEFLSSISGRDRSQLSASAADQFAYAAERLRMHRTVLETPGEDVRRRVVPRMQAGEGIRVFSIAIGGLDLDMKSALSRARGRKLGLGAAPGTATVLPASLGLTLSPAWKRDPRGLPPQRIPQHGSNGGSGVEHRRRVEATRIQTIYASSSIDARLRSLKYGDDGILESIERYEDRRRIHYRWVADKSGKTFRAESLLEPLAPDAFAAIPDRMAPGLTIFQVRDRVGEKRIPVRLQSRPTADSQQQIEATLPRTELQRLVLGHSADFAAGRPLGGLTTFPPQLGSVSTLMLLQQPSHAAEPWDEMAGTGFGETRADVLARSLNEWWGDDGAYASVVGTDPLRSAERWEAMGSIRGPVSLVYLVGDSTAADRLKEIRKVWKAGPVQTALSGGGAPRLTVVLSDEPPAVLARRLTRIARDPSYTGHALAVWSLAGPLRRDLPARWLDADRLAAIGIGSETIVTRRRFEQSLKTLSDAIQQASSEATRLEELAGPFLWYY